jgi:LuxR family maltose regulon positive regulatory protein
MLALDTIRRALHLGEAGGFVRSFVDAGPPVGALIGRLAARDDIGIRPDYLVRVLSVFHPPSPDVVPPGSRGSTAPELTDPLTPRELEVLELLTARLSNKEIARRLAISPLTVKRHTLAIYDKLGVRGRAAAAARARALGLVDPP